MPKTLDELVVNIVDWAEERNLILGSLPEKQLQKTAEELIELAVAVGKDTAYATHVPSEDSGTIYAGDLMDGIGDTVVTLVIVAEQLGLDFAQCVEFAYDEIKHRKGTVINGKFVKQEAA